MASRKDVKPMGTLTRWQLLRLTQSLGRRSEFAHARLRRLVCAVHLLTVGPLVGLVAVFTATLIDAVGRGNAWVGAHRAHLWGALAFLYVFALVSHVVNWQGQRYTFDRLRALLVSRRLEVCLRCGYSVSGIGETGVCPECGRPFELRALRDEWKKILRLLGRPVD